VGAAPVSLNNVGQHQRFEGALPADCGELCWLIWDSVAKLFVGWNAVLTLFGTDQGTVDLLHDAAPTFFARLRGVLIDDVILRVSRLTDLATTRVRGEDRENVSFHALASCLECAGFPKPAVEIRAGLEKIRPQLDVIRAHRSRRVAHADAASLIQSSSEVLIGLRREDITRARDGLAEVMNAVENAFLPGESTSFKYSFEIGGAEQLLQRLRDARKFREQRSARFAGSRA
jgi:hypothetical protein